MQIIWHGQSFFQILANRGKNGQVSILISPFAEDTGLRIPKAEADIIIVPNENYKSNTKAFSNGGKPFLIWGPGEYEVKDVFIYGINALTDEKSPNTIYIIEIEDIKICHLGDFNEKDLTEDKIEKIGDIDVLLVPVGGQNTISAKEALQIMSKIEPRITIPMTYQIPKLKMKLDGLDKFFKALGVKPIEALPKLTIKKKDIEPEEAKIIILNP